MSDSFFDFDAINRGIEGDVFDERPVDIEEFIYGENYLNQVGIRLSDNQLKMMQVMTQVYKKETLIYLYGEEVGNRRWNDTYNEVVMCLGKGSGKDFVSTLACAYIVYQLMCLKDPAAYFGRPPGDQIDLLNVAINADQARRVFFNGFKTKIDRSPWFAGRYAPTAIEFVFDKNIHVFSGHSERESFEGLNLIFCVLDEIAGFAMDKPSTTANEEEEAALNKTAQSIYKMYKASISSRYKETGKLVLLSFPRYKNDFIDSHYKKVVSPVDLVVIPRQHTFKINPDLPDGTEGNETTIEWEEDHIANYTRPKVFALRRPTWEFNPTKTIDDFASDFFDDPLDAIGRFAAQPPEGVGGFFRSHDKIDKFVMGSNLVNIDTGDWRESAKPDPTKEYFIHVDLALKHDNAALALSHVDHWQRREFNKELSEVLPYIKVDLLKVWKPGPTRSVDFADIKEFILGIVQKGFNVKLITLDRWRSDEMLEWIHNMGMRGEILSVGLPHYQDLLGITNEERALAPDSELLRVELKQLRLVNNGKKIDHPRTGSKDLADAVCGSVFNAMSRSTQDFGDEIEVLSMEDLRLQRLRGTMAEQPVPTRPHAPDGVEIPDEIMSLLGLRVL